MLPTTLTLIAALGGPPWAAAAPACTSSLDTRFELERSLPGTAAESDDTIVLLAGSLDARIGGRTRLRDGVVLRQGEQLAGADSVDIDPLTRSLYLAGKVRYQDPATQILAANAEFSYDLGLVRFTSARFALPGNGSRGSADRLRIDRSGRLELEDVTYTTCPEGAPDWLIEARAIDLDTASGIGTAKQIRMRFKGMPILYAPAISFPIGDARKTGWLTPEIGSASINGNELRTPFYWNIAANFDATITPRLLTRRGPQLGTQLRYLTRHMSGTVYGEYLHEDNLTGSNRYLGRIDHRAAWAPRWLHRLKAVGVSDSQYIEDLGGTLSNTAITHLDRSLRFDYFGSTLRFSGRVQDFQTIDDAIAAADQPYRRLPELVLNGRWPAIQGKLTFGLDSELTNFHRDTGVNGWRLNAIPQLTFKAAGAGWFVTPSLAYDYTRYRLTRLRPGAERHPERGLPISSLDTGLLFERDIRDGRWLQTIEPRALLVSIPFREQSDLPVFDTITPDLNLVQLFRKNRFLGKDRVGDTDQISVGFTSRILDLGSGREIMSATIGQTRYLSARRVSLPGRGSDTRKNSDYIAELRFRFLRKLSFDLAQQWSSGGGTTTRTQTRLQYRPASNRIVNVAYRFRRGALAQGDVSWSWPVATHWTFVGRYNFSFRDRELLEQFFGLQYESCCWGLRLVSRRFISRRDGSRDSSFGVQLVFKGLASVGTAADKLLERGILGYSADLR